MRLSVVFLFLSLGIAVANNSYAQNTTLSLEMSNSTIANVLEAVENQTDFSFIYDANVVNINKKVSVSVNEKNIFDVLNKMFGNSDIAYTVVNKKIILNRKKLSCSNRVNACRVWLSIRTTNRLSALISW